MSCEVGDISTTSPPQSIRTLQTRSSTSHYNMVDKKESSSASLTAAYESPNGQKQFKHALTVPPSSDLNPQAKAKYLSELRASTRKLQDDINKFLTGKMEEDKKVAEQNGPAKQNSKDEMEEENYGEEVIEDET